MPVETYTPPSADDTLRAADAELAYLESLYTNSLTFDAPMSGPQRNQTAWSSITWAFEKSLPPPTVSQLTLLQAQGGCYVACPIRTELNRILHAIQHQRPASVDGCRQTLARLRGSIAAIRSCVQLLCSSNAPCPYNSQHAVQPKKEFANKVDAALQAVLYEFSKKLTGKRILDRHQFALLAQQSETLCGLVRIPNSGVSTNTAAFFLAQVKKQAAENVIEEQVVIEDLGGLRTPPQPSRIVGPGVPETFAAGMLQLVRTSGNAMRAKDRYVSYPAVQVSPQLIV
ncbi:MAG: hypothetical protein G01um101425_909 [Candidatus Peregrinibacteria bacterium Gr01-1014_25]|nr:MAG: hypothetical protein G01um101425_909 [Candidatus Peregrinibacteria bacterium Gr01-1014_25]